MFKAILLTKDDHGFAAAVKDLSEDALVEATPQAQVTVKVDWSTMNYKDALALSDRSPVVRRWPMVAGIDATGVVVETSDHPQWRRGDAVILNGWGCGETQWGGLSQRLRVPAAHLVGLPAGLSAREAMAIGTAGYTAMLCCLALETGGAIASGNEILVTGASGGVGSVAIAILSAWGVKVVASTGRLEETDYLKSLGATEVIDRQSLSLPGKPLQKDRWAGVVDAVGSHTLANACAQTRYGGVVTACGLAQGMDFPGSVAPFILRGVSLLGIDSVMCPQARRIAAWARLASDLDRSKLAEITRTISLGDTIALAPDLLAGKVRGRVVVDVNQS